MNPLNVILLQLLTQYRISPLGILHVGANDAREAMDYVTMGFGQGMFFEANPSLHEPVENEIKRMRQFGFRGELVPVAVSDRKGTATFYCTNWNPCGSLFPLSDACHKFYPGLHQGGMLEVPTDTLDALVKNKPAFNVLVMDIQGAELLALKGGVETLAHIAIVQTELDHTPLYQGGALSREVEAFLDTQGFKRKAMRTEQNGAWGDAWFIKKELLA